MVLSFFQVSVHGMSTALTGTTMTVLRILFVTGNGCTYANVRSIRASTPSFMSVTGANM